MNMMKIFIYVFLFILLGLNITYGFELKDKIFSVTLPNEWERIPKKIIDPFIEQINQMAEKAPKQHFEYGFQLKSSKKRLEYPYILVSIENSGRIPEYQLKKSHTYPVQKYFDEQKQGLSSLLSDSQLGRMLYDEQSNIIWLLGKSNVANIGLVSGLSGIIPTKKGYITFVCAALEKDYAKYETTFQSIILSVSLKPGHLYFGK